MTTSSEPRTRSARVVLPWWVALPVVVVAILAAAFAGFLFGRSAAQNEANAVPILGNAPQYTMTNQFGKKVASLSSRGGFHLATSFFPDCATTCSSITAHFVNFGNLDLMPAGLAGRVEIVSFNIDPTGTGSKEMRVFLSQYGWNPEAPSWLHLTSTPDEARSVASTGFGVWYMRVGYLSAQPRPGNSGAGNAVEQPGRVDPTVRRAPVDYDALDAVAPQGGFRKFYRNADTVGPQRMVSATERVRRG